MLGVVALASAVCGGLAMLLTWLAPAPLIEVVVVAVAGVLVLGFETIVALRIPFESSVATDGDCAPATSAATATEAAGGVR
jgi:hypothetical protein